ncbi:MAG TPA: inositol monophosphatase family protein [Aeromicrobium sp.]|nr:inositol monophosphatase family protein [Aeromicrobium sp.]
MLADVDLAVRLVRDAGALAARMRVEGLDAEQKTSVSDVVTAADHAAERLVTDLLRQQRPDDGILGEEGTAHEGRSGRRWVIDPVDGTYNFFSGLSYWCSALALQDADRLVLGAVHRPETDQTWIGGPDLPTTCNDTPVSPLQDVPLAQCSVATYIHPGTLDDPGKGGVWRSIVDAVSTPRMLGSGSCDLAGVASGRIGVFAGHSCPEWDWLPGRALVEAAGGRTEVVQVHGTRWHLAGNRLAVEELVERVVGTSV